MSAALPRPVSARRLTGAGWRAALVVAGALAVALEAPAWVRLPLSAAAVLGVATLLVGRSRRGLLEPVLVLAGGGLVALVLTGLLLNLLPVGLGPLGWGVAVGLVELAALGVLTARTPVGRPRRLPRARIGTLAWAVAALAVLAGAVAFSAASFDTTHVPLLAVAAVPRGDQVVVTVSAGAEQGPFELDLVTAGGRTVIATQVRVAPGRAFTKRIALPSSRAVLQLVPAGSSAPARQLILDPTTKATDR